MEGDEVVAHDVTEGDMVRDTVVGEGGDVDWLMTDAGGDGTTDVANGGDSSGDSSVGDSGGKGKKRQKHQTHRRRNESTADSVINPSQISQSNDASSPSQISQSNDASSTPSQISQSSDASSTPSQKHSYNRRKLKESLYGKFNRAGGGNDHALRSSCCPIITRQITRSMHSDHTCCPINTPPYPVSPSFVTPLISLLFSLHPFFFLPPFPSVTH